MLLVKIQNLNIVGFGVWCSLLSNKTQACHYAGKKLVSFVFVMLMSIPECFILEIPDTLSQ